MNTQVETYDTRAVLLNHALISGVADDIFALLSDTIEASYLPSPLTLINNGSSH